MLEAPFLSVIMPTYNGEAFLAEALESLVAQQDEGVEVVTVDDGSTDGTLEILGSYAARLRLKILEESHTGNWVAATNIGLRSASGQYVSLLHQDDIWSRGRVSQIRSILSSHSPALLVHPIWFIGPDGRGAGSWRCPLPPGRPLTPDFVTPRLLIQNFISVLGTVFPRQVVMDSGGMDENLWYTADWDLWLRLARIGPTWHVPSRLGAYRIHPETQTATRSARLAEFRDQLETVLDRHLDERTPRPIEQTARFSVEVNVILAGMSHARRPPIARLLARFLSLGPSGWWRYLRYSRIVERAGSRLRVRRRESP